MYPTKWVLGVLGVRDVNHKATSHQQLEFGSAVVLMMSYTVLCLCHVNMLYDFTV